MRIKLGTRLFLGLASTSGLVLICALAGYQGIHNLSAALGYLSGPVWDTGRGATSVRAGVQAELLAVSELLGSDRRDGERVALEQAEQSTDQAAARMFASALIEAESREAFMRDLRTFREARTEVLDAHDRYRRANARVLEEFYRFQELMLDVQRLGDGYMEELAAFPGEDLSWTTTLRPRWAAAKAAMESRISLLARFFHFQRALSQGLDADALAELDYYLGVMEETFAEITGHPTLGPLPLTQGEFAGQSVAAVLDERARAHVEGFEQTLEAFRGLRASTQRYRAASQSLLVMAEDIVQAGDARIQEQAALVRQSTSVAYAWLMVAVVLGLVLSVLLVILNVRTVSRPLSQLKSTALRILDRDLRDDGRLTTLTRGRSDFTEIAEVFTAMQRTLREMIGNVDAGVTTMVASSEQISDTARHSAQSATRQVQSVKRINSTVNHLLEVANSTSAHADGVLENARTARERGERGLESIAESDLTMADVVAQAEAVREKLLGLAEQSRRADSILESVNRIADQSNILALNAGIEASKAGADGVGFAVLAGEIRRLSVQSKEATRHIREILDEMETATQSVLEVSDRGANRAQLGQSSVQSVRNVIAELAQMLESSEARARQIAEAVQQQRSGIAEIAEAISVVSKDSEKSAAGARDLESSAASVLSVAQRLGGVTAAFSV